MIAQGYIEKAMPDRILFGLVIGLVASGGMSLLRDIGYAPARPRERSSPGGFTLLMSLLGIFLGSAGGFLSVYAQQVPVIL